MADWIAVFLLAAILILLIEARRNFGSRIALVERDLEWIGASLQKWGLIAPQKDDKT